MDDSSLFQEMLFGEAVHEPNIEKLICAKEPIEAFHIINTYQPDIMLCNIELLLKNGMEYVYKLLKEIPIPVIAIASRHDLKHPVIQAGAVSFVYRPQTASQAELCTFVKMLLKLAVYHIHSKRNIQENTSIQQSSKVIAIGATRGGTEAIVSVLSAMPSNCPPVLIAHHAPLGDSAMFVERLKYSCSMLVKQAEHGDVLRPGLVLVAPASGHMTLTCVQEQFKVECIADDLYNEQVYKPSLDLLFHSVALTMEQHAIGILLNGNDHDGIEGLLQMRNAGAITFAQNEHGNSGTASDAYRRGAAGKLIPLERAAKEIYRAL